MQDRGENKTPSERVVMRMQETVCEQRLNEDLVDTLTAISVVAKLMARIIRIEGRQNDVEDERTGQGAE
jgi:hypothetical protein